MGPEEENFAFYQAHRQKLSKRPVYLQCRSLSTQAVKSPLLHLFCPEENAARLFWRQKGMFELSRQHGHRLRIVLLGLGKLGEEVLLRGLQSNIFSPGQAIEYHIFGTADRFAAVHRGIAQIEDPVIFHRDAWYTQLALLETADLLLVLEQAQQAALLEDLLLATTRQDIDVFAGAGLASSPLAEQKRVRLFFWEQAACDLKIVLMTPLLARAKAINLRYSHLYAGVAETAENREAEGSWMPSPGVNISAADYHLVRLDMLKAMGLPASAEKLPGETLELLAQLEHMRWCRYHYLNNWAFGQPENGKRKDLACGFTPTWCPMKTLRMQSARKTVKISAFFFPWKTAVRKRPVFARRLGKDASPCHSVRRFAPARQMGRPSGLISVQKRRCPVEHSVFISYHHDSSVQLVERIVQALESSGIKCWYAPGMCNPNMRGHCARH